MQNFSYCPFFFCVTNVVDHPNAHTSVFPLNFIYFQNNSLCSCSHKSTVTFIILNFFPTFINRRSRESINNNLFNISKHCIRGFSISQWIWSEYAAQLVRKRWSRHYYTRLSSTTEAQKQTKRDETKRAVQKGSNTTTFQYKPPSMCLQGRRCAVSLFISLTSCYHHYHRHHVQFLQAFLIMR